MVEPSTVVFVSVLFLVVINLSIIVKDDLERKAMQYSGHFLFFPNLGRFTFIHAVNASLLFLGYLVVFGNTIQYRDVIGEMLLFTIGLILLLLPFIEIDSYEDGFKNGKYPNSFTFHIGFTLVATFLPILFVVEVILLDSGLIRRFFNPVSFVVWLGGIYGFLWLVKNEYRPSRVE